ncbi:MAG: enoyl-CoA hydratase/isomerase family protein [Actinomycetota bacterium]|nr:enoyl-CoA hydratase/isomerase family protein [Actinomycetota bacterium]
MEHLIFERQGPVGWLRLNRPDKLNSWTFAMWEEMAELGGELVADQELRALVVIGEGRAFSSGIDTSTFTPGQGGDLFTEAGSGAPTENSDDDKLVTAITDLQGCYSWLAEAPYPTIAAVRGYALGAGMQLALACDLRIIVRGTKLGLPEHRYGLLPDLGGLYWLPRLVGVAKAKELVWTGETIDADEALRIGLANRVVRDDELETTVAALAETVAGQPPIAVAGSKRAIEAAPAQGLTEGLREAAVGQAECIRSADFLEAVAAFSERRPPRYQNR